MKSLITPIGGLYVAAGGINVFAALSLLVYAIFPAVIGVVAVSGAMKQEEGALPALIVMAASSIGIGGMGLIVGVLAIAYLIGGVGIIMRKRWARMLGVLLAIPTMTVCMPVGTILGVLAIVALVSKEGVEEFGGAG